MTTIGFIGAGQMAQALASGIAASDTSVKFAIASPGKANRDTFCDKVGGNVEVYPENADIFAHCDIVFLAFKPQYFADAIDVTAVGKVIADAGSNPLVVSIMAGVTIEKITQFTGLDRVIRIMPNTPSLIGEGALGITASQTVAGDDLKTVNDLMSSVGCVVNVSEQLMDALTGLSGSGPAYVFTFIESLIDAGVLNGLPRSVARQLAIQTVIGSAKLVEESGDHPAVLRDQVTSPGGATIAAMNVLETNNFRGTVIQAVGASTSRSKELGHFKPQ